jgi:hypothetical protein
MAECTKLFSNDSQGGVLIALGILTALDDQGHDGAGTHTVIKQVKDLDNI